MSHELESTFKHLLARAKRKPPIAPPGFVLEQRVLATLAEGQKAQLELFRELRNDMEMPYRTFLYRLHRMKSKGLVVLVRPKRLSTKEIHRRYRARKRGQAVEPWSQVWVRLA